MILRTWNGRTRLSDGDAYETFMINRAMPDYQATDGLIDLIFSRRDDRDVSHFLLVTMWRDIDAVHEFAGRDAEQAKYYPEDSQYLLEKDPNALNYRVFQTLK